MNQRAPTFCNCDVWYIRVSFVQSSTWTNVKIKLREFDISEFIERAVNVTPLNSLLVFSYMSHSHMKVLLNDTKFNIPN